MGLLEELDSILSYVKQIKNLEKDLGIGLITLISLLSIQEKLITIYTKDSPRCKKINEVETRLMIDICNKRATVFGYLDSVTCDTVIVKKPRERLVHYPFSEYGKTWALTKEELL